MEQNKFNGWADYYFTKDKLNQFLRLQQCIDDCNTKFGCNLLKETFRCHLLHWCEQYGYELDPHPMRSNGMIRRAFKGFDGEQEAIYIKKTDFPQQPDFTPQYEIYVYFSPTGYYTSKCDKLSDAIAHVRNLSVITEISRIAIQKIQPKEAAE